MPVEVIWDDEDKTILRQIYTGMVVETDYYQAIDEFVVLNVGSRIAPKLVSDVQIVNTLEYAYALINQQSQAIS